MTQPTPVLPTSGLRAESANLRGRTSRAVRQAVGALLALAVVAGVAAAVPSPASAWSTEQVLEAQVLQQLNGERAARGLKPLAADAGLENASQAWSNSMSGGQNLVHSSDGRAEIIARGWWTGQITDAWMRSDGHRNLVVDPNLTVAGVAVACDARGQMWVTVQFYQANTSLGTLRSSAASPVVTPANLGSDCGEGVLVGQVRRLYSAYFRRESDQPGLAYWVGRMSEGSGLGDVAAFFASSPEFKNTYGRLSNGDFVRLVYRNVMGREPDGVGLQYWVSQLDQGLNRGHLMIGFSESAEFRQRSGIN